MTSHLKGRFVVFLEWLFIGYVRLGYIGLGDCLTGLGNGPAVLEPIAEARNRSKPSVKNTKNRPLRCDIMKGTIPAQSCI